MQKIKFDFEATKQLIYAPNSTAPIGAPVDADGNVANDDTAIGIVLCRRNESDKYWVKQNLVVMVAGYCDIIDAQAIWGDEYSAEAMAAMSDITFCDNHQLPTGGGGGAMVVHITSADGVNFNADKTFAEIYTAFPNVTALLMMPGATIKASSHIITDGFVLFGTQMAFERSGTNIVGISQNVVQIFSDDRVDFTASNYTFN